MHTNAAASGTAAIFSRAGWVGGRASALGARSTIRVSSGSRSAAAVSASASSPVPVMTISVARSRRSSALSSEAWPMRFSPTVRRARLRSAGPPSRATRRRRKETRAAPGFVLQCRSGSAWHRHALRRGAPPALRHRPPSGSSPHCRDWRSAGRASAATRAPGQGKSARRSPRTVPRRPGSCRRSPRRGPGTCSRPARQECPSR